MTQRDEKTPVKKGPWSPEEDHKLIAYIRRYGIWNWSQMPKPAGLARSGKSCRLRWVNYLRPDIKRGSFSKDEERTILELHQTIGNRWSVIAAALPGRTDNEIKNYWNTHLKKRFKAVESAQEENVNHEKSNLSSKGGVFLVDEASKGPKSETTSSSSSSGLVHEIAAHKNRMAEKRASETFEELQSFWGQSDAVPDFHQEMFTEHPGFRLSAPQLWLQEPICPCDNASYIDASSDYWVNLINTG